MFEQLFRPADTVEQYQTAALVESRLRYLRHWLKLGAKRSTLRRIAINQLEVVRLLDLREGSGKVSLAQVEAAAAQWALPRLRRSGKHAKPVAVAKFIARATRWLSFLGRLEVPPVVARHQHAAKVAAFADWMRTERGLSEHTIHSRCRIVDEFLSRFGDEDRPLHTLTIADLDRLVAEKSASGRCIRVSICSYAIRLRIFFRYAAGRGWCVPGLAAAIMPERRCRGETVPAALAWEDVQRLLGTTEGEHPADKRDRAVVLLFAVYGLRAGEASGLRLEDIDWEQETLQVLSQAGTDTPVSVVPQRRGRSGALPARSAPALLRACPVPHTQSPVPPACYRRSAGHRQPSLAAPRCRLAAPRTTRATPRMRAAPVGPRAVV